MIKQPAAQDRAEREAEESGAAHGSDRARPLLRREHHRHHRERERHDDGGGQAERDPGRDQLAAARGVGAGERRQSEQHQRPEQQLLAAVPVAEQARRQQGRGQHQAVGVEEPLRVTG